ncbi:MAG: PIN domain nuclease [Burkholderiales bacterium]
MILVDSSVWVDYLRGKATHQTEKLDMLLGTEPLAIGDLILAEVLQGCMTDKEFNAVKRSLATLDFVVLGVEEVAVEAAKNFRKLRVKGITVRKTIDTIIATRCIVSGYRLLHNDKDFDVFEKYLGPKCVNCETQRINSAVDAAMCVSPLQHRVRKALPSPEPLSINLNYKRFICVGVKENQS